MDPTVTCELEVFDNMRTKIRTLEVSNAKLQNRLSEAAISGSRHNPWWRRVLGMVSVEKPDTSVTERMRDTVRMALPVVQFAQANLDPETIRGWPHAKLKELAEAVLQMPGANQFELDWAKDALHYAEAARLIEDLRKKGLHKELEMVPRSGTASGDYAKKAMEILGKSTGLDEDGQSQET